MAGARMLSLRCDESESGIAYRGAGRDQRRDPGGPAGGERSCRPGLDCRTLDAGASIGTAEEFQAGQAIAGSSFFSPAIRIIAFWSFSKARTSIWRTRSRLTP